MSADDPNVIYAFACTSGDTVHYVVVKRSAKRASFFGELLELLLGDRLRRACGYTSDLIEMRRPDPTTRAPSVIPRSWYRDDHWYLRKQLGGRAA